MQTSLASATGVSPWVSTLTGQQQILLSRGMGTFSLPVPGLPGVQLHHALHGDGPRTDAIQPGSVRMSADPPPGGHTALSSGRVRKMTMGGCGSVPRLHGSCRVLKCTP